LQSVRTFGDQLATARLQGVDVGRVLVKGLHGYLRACWKECLDSGNVDGTTHDRAEVRGRRLGRLLGAGALEVRLDCGVDRCREIGGLLAERCATERNRVVISSAKALKAALTTDS
jgi:hypothetical protein